MTTIDELEEMDFINWDAAGADTGFDFAPSKGVVNSGVDEANPMDLVLNDVDGDDWSFWALQHFESTQAPQEFPLPEFTEPLATMAEPLATQLYWEIPESPCGHCARGGYQCKRIQEGCYKGYCTSCVALRCECSFGPLGNHAGLENGDTFPANPWPVMGDRPETSILHEDDLAATMNPTLSHRSPAVAGTDEKMPSPQAMPKIGARLSRESVRILKNWVSTHNRHPYPTEEEKESLQKITGLNKTQITNWLANARRRGKIQPTRSTSPHVGRGYAQAMNIPQRNGDMNPLQRWQNSPPENEPASVTAIARAVTASNSAVSSSSGLNSPRISGYSDDGSSRSLCNQSSASSFSNSYGSSAGSFGSSFSHQSRGSFGSLPSFVRSNRGRRRRRKAPAKPAEQGLQQPLKTFQCTFCTETFKTKHDWQRHEKSLHLSLERWICSPDGGKALNPENGLICCVFCGESNPDNAHIESHNCSSCKERTLEERTFYRKDHLRQHLKLVHEVKFLSWSMDKWRVSTPSIRSRCGFCGIVMDNWTFRVDHLAEHFKTGNTMADWKGDWGFEAPVLQMVENSIPPYLIHDERNSPLPYMATQSASTTPNSAYELLKSELQYWTENWIDDHGKQATDDEMQYEGCRIIFAAELLSTRTEPHASWLRDIILSNESITQTAMYQPIRRQSENQLSVLRINGKKNIFEECEVEKQLQEFVTARELLGLTAMDHELQVEACKIIARMEGKSNNPSEDVANFLLRLIRASSKWLADFRNRAHLPRSEDIVSNDERSKDPMLIDSTIHNYCRLERELGQFLQVQRSLGVEPSDVDLQRHARNVIYDNDDDWNQTAADDPEWLGGFKERQPPPDAGDFIPASAIPSASDLLPNSLQLPTLPSNYGSSSAGMAHDRVTSMKVGPVFLNDANCWRRLARGLSRFVASTTSANNPNRHVPTDEELQHQARWIIYDDDDPWNQTAADNAEWLQRFKRDVGILSADSGPGLPSEELPWTPPSGGTGFTPPSVRPNLAAAVEPLQETSKIFCRENTKPFEPDTTTANRYLSSMKQQYPAPAKVFCSRELENGMTEYVNREMSKSGVLPSDDEMRTRAREIMSMQKTAVDDPMLLEKFKATFQASGLVGQSASASAAVPGVPSGSASVPLGGVDVFPPDMAMTLTNQEVNEIIQDVNNGFGDGMFLDL